MMSDSQALVECPLYQKNDQELYNLHEKRMIPYRQTLNLSHEELTIQDASIPN